MRLAPGLGPRGGQHGQAKRPDQPAGRRARSAEQRHGEAGQRPARVQRQSLGQLRTVKTVETRGDIGQQRPRDDIAERHAGPAREQRQREKFEGHRRDQRARRDADRPQRADRRQPLLEGEAERGVDDKQPHEKGEQSEGGEVEMKTARQSFEIGVLVRLDQPQRVADNARERLRAFRLQHQPRQALRAIQQPLRDADVDDQRSRRRGAQRAQRRQRKPPLGLRPLAYLGERLRRRETEPRGFKKIHDPLPLAKTGESRAARQSQGLDADDSQGLVANADRSLQHRRNLPAGEAQLDIEVLRE